MAIKKCILDITDKKKEMEETVVSIINKTFPITGNKFTLRIKNIIPGSTEVTLAAMKEAVQKRKTLSVPVTGDLELIDNSNQKVLDVKNKVRICSYPAYTPYGTTIIDGNEYSTAMLMKLKPGTYTYVAGDNKTYCDFQVRGKSMYVTINAETGVFYIGTGSIQSSLYAVLTRLGASDALMQQYWGIGLFNENKISSHKVDVEFKKFANQFIKNEKDVNKLKDGLLERFKNTELSPDVTSVTLGKEFTHINLENILMASKKVVNVMNSKELEDEKDDLAFQTVDSSADRLRTYMDSKIRDFKLKAVAKMRFLTDAKHNDLITKGKGFLIDYILGSTTQLSNNFKSFYNDDQLTSTADFTNPVERWDLNYKVSKVGGEGGVQSGYSVTDKMREVHPSSFGLIDVVRSPVSDKAGIDIRFTDAAYKDEQGNLYLRVLNIKNFNIEKLPIKTLRNEKIILPTEFKKIAHLIPKLRKNLATEKELSTMVKVYSGNSNFQEVPLKDAKYIIEKVSNMFSPTSNIIPLMNSTEGARLMMNTSQVTQALALKDTEAPYVQTVNNFDHLQHKFTKLPKIEGFNSEEGTLLQKHRYNVTAPADGVVVKIDKQKQVIVFKSNIGKVYNLNFHNYYPTQKSMLHHDIVCKEGQKCNKGDLLGKSIFSTDKGELALGKNLNIAYMTYHGLNHEDAIIMSESGAKKLTSRHLKSEIISFTKDYIMQRDKFKAVYPTKYNTTQYNNLDNEGVVKPKITLKKGDPFFVSLVKIPSNRQIDQLMKLHKSFASQYKGEMHEWSYPYDATVIEVTKSRTSLHIMLEYYAPAVAGDKLTGRFSNKGVIVEVIPDDKMPKIEGEDKPLDMIQTPAGVIGRINPSQLIETSLGEVAHRTKKPIFVETFGSTDNLALAKRILAKEHIEPYKKVFDPKTGLTTSSPVQTGYQYIYKLKKTTDGNFAARSLGSYDLNEQPLKVPGSGKDSPKSIGTMEVAGYLAHNSREMIKDMYLKGQQNTDYWNAIKYNRFAPKPADNFAFKQKFKGLLTMGGLDLKQENDNWKLIPLTSKEIDSMSNGELKNYKQVSLKNMEPEPGGLFDKKIFGGLNGNKFGHINLDEPMLNPMFITAIRLLLKITEKDLKNLFKTKGGDHIKNLLRGINLNTVEKQALKEIETDTGQKLSNALKLVKIIRAMKDNNIRPEEVCIMDKVVVIPPKLRPLIYINNRLENTPINLLYKEVMLSLEALKTAKSIGLTSDIEDSRVLLQKNVDALIGLSDTPNKELAKKRAVGAIKIITSDQPKHSFVHSKLIKKTQDFSGRATIAPDVDLSIDEIGLPEEMAWKLYEIEISKKMSQMGYNPIQINESIKKRDHVAKQALNMIIKDHPVYVNRPPTLWAHSIFAAYPKLTPGKTLKVSPFIEAGCNADYDGDALIVHLPVSDKAKEEAKTKTMSYQLFGEKNKNNLLALPTHEPVIGFYKSTADQSKNVVKFKTYADMQEALKSGKINFSQQVEIG
jgi:DNA-directed RNA polymerase beta subunit